MKKLTSIACILFVVAGFLFSCEKDDTDNQVHDSELIYSEEAYPGIQGDTVSIILNGENVTCEVINGEYIFQGDIILVPDATKSAGGAGLEVSSKRWPGGVVYYSIEKNFPNQHRITSAIEHWELTTGITFKLRDEEPNYVEFVWDKKGCSSSLGMKGGKQKIRIADWGRTGTVVHEIGHALGLLHEQSKLNRDEHITVHFDNIEWGKKHNFRVKKKSIQTEGFDFGSIMLYSSLAFSKDYEKKLYTITKKDGSPFTSQRANLSSQDIEMIDEMYSNLGMACNQSVSITHQEKSVSEIETLVENEDLQNFSAESANYVYKITINAGGGYNTHTKMAICLDDVVPLSGYVKGTSDASEVQRTRIGPDMNHFLQFNAKGWTDASGFIEYEKLFLILDSKWGSDIDTYIDFWFVTTGQINTLGYVLIDDNTDDFGSIKVNGYIIK